MTRTPPRTAEKRALLLSFVAFGSFWGALAALLPDLRAQVGVDDGQLGLAMGAVALSALPAMPLAGRLMDRSGAARLLPLSLVAFAAVTPLSASRPRCRRSSPRSSGSAPPPACSTSRSTRRPPPGSGSRTTG